MTDVKSTVYSISNRNNMPSLLIRKDDIRTAMLEREGSYDIVGIKAGGITTECLLIAGHLRLILVHPKHLFTVTREQDERRVEIIII
jgi:hypothetical protein